MATRATGAHWEKSALNFLQDKGLRFIRKNFYCRQGEIDLIMLQENILVIIEVRSRTSNSFTTPAETINQTKQRKIIKTTELFLQRHPEHRKRMVRFDVIELIGDQQNYQLRWIQNAFQANCA